MVIILWQVDIKIWQIDVKIWQDTRKSDKSTLKSDKCWQNLGTIAIIFKMVVEIAIS